MSLLFYKKQVLVDTGEARKKVGRGQHPLRILQNMKSCGLSAPRWHESPSPPAAPLQNIKTRRVSVVTVVLRTECLVLRNNAAATLCQSTDIAVRCRRGATRSAVHVFLVCCDVGANCCYIATLAAKLELGVRARRSIACSAPTSACEESAGAVAALSAEVLAQVHCAA